MRDKSKGRWRGEQKGCRGVSGGSIYFWGVYGKGIKEMKEKE